MGVRWELALAPSLEPTKDCPVHVHYRFPFHHRDGGSQERGAIPAMAVLELGSQGDGAPISAAGSNLRPEKI